MVLECIKECGAALLVFGLIGGYCLFRLGRGLLDDLRKAVRRK